MIKILGYYSGQYGSVKLLDMDNHYKVVFDTNVRPGIIYHREIPCQTYDAALHKYLAIEKIYTAQQPALCGFYSNSGLKPVCSKDNCPKLLGGAAFWERFAYNCVYNSK